MGGGASNSKSMFDYSYRKEREELRRQLILSFLSDPENEDIVSKIKAVRSLVIKHPHICATAAKEAANEFDCSPTNIEAAFHELDRLYTIYETSTILKSAQCRVGNVACPVGHYAPYFEATSNSESNAYFNFFGGNANHEKCSCNMCDKAITSGYQCSYCNYNYCVTCSVIYCSYGHTMKLWTNAESQHHCEICRAENITSGYRCTTCEVDFCDMCTYKEGRKHLQEEILARVKVDLIYIDDHQSESETALTTMKRHRKKLANNSYSSIKELYDWSLTVNDIRVICEAEVRQTRITKEIIRLRSLIIVGIEFCATAQREAKIIDTYTQQEMERLTIIQDANVHAMSSSVRDSTTVACPLGHGAIHYVGRPIQYQRRDSILKKTSPTCKVCKRVAAEGYHCDFCEYDLCTTCSTIWCSKGHSMTMWTIPEANTNCYLCTKSDMTRGYHCNYCMVDVCDICTSVNGRKNVRNAWEDEMQSLIQFMRDNKRYSDIALYYHWRHLHYIVSTGRLIEYVQELRAAQKRAIKQIQQKTIIDAIKKLREEVTAYPDLNVTAQREANRSKAYIYPNKKRAQAELDRLQDILDDMNRHKSMESRSKYSIACPLAHGMVKITDLPAELQSIYTLDEIIQMQQEQQLVAVNGSGDVKVENPFEYVLLGRRDPDNYNTNTNTSTSQSAKYNAISSNMNIVTFDSIPEYIGSKSYDTYYTSPSSPVNNKQSVATTAMKTLIDDIMPSHDTFDTPSNTVGDIKIAFSFDSITAQEGSLHGLNLNTTATTTNSDVNGGYDSRYDVKTSDDKILGDLDCNRDDHENRVIMKRLMMQEQQELRAKNANYIPNNDNTNLSVQQNHNSNMNSINTTAINYNKEDFESSQKSVAEDETHIIVAALRRKNLYLQHYCKVCGVSAAPNTAVIDNVTGNYIRAGGGYTCSICEYDLCIDCAKVYCRYGHELKIWTLPEANSLCCDMCKTNSITSGYRCLQCEIDICDMCTTKDARNAFMLWPRREINKIIKELELLKGRSVLVDRFFIEHPKDTRYLVSMSTLCKKLKDVEELKQLADDEIRKKRLAITQGKYGYIANDM